VTLLLKFINFSLSETTILSGNRKTSINHIYDFFFVRASFLCSLQGMKIYQNVHRKAPSLIR